MPQFKITSRRVNTLIVIFGLSIISIRPILISRRWFEEDVILPVGLHTWHVWMVLLMDSVATQWRNKYVDMMVYIWLLLFLFLLCSFSIVHQIVYRTGTFVLYATTRRTKKWKLQAITGTSWVAFKHKSCTKSYR